MIIERKYVPFCVLRNRDKEAWEIFEKALNESYPREGRDRSIEMLLPQCLYQKQMGWGFKKLGDVIEGFEKLDKEKPYDNGLSYKDVNEVEIVSRGDGELVLHLIHRFDGIYHIVKIVKFED